MSISSPVGQGAGEFNENYVVGIISTTRGQAEFVCAGFAVTGASLDLLSSLTIHISSIGPCLVTTKGVSSAPRP